MTSVEVTQELPHMWLIASHSKTRFPASFFQRGACDAYHTVDAVEEKGIFFFLVPSDVSLWFYNL